MNKKGQIDLSETGLPGLIVMAFAVILVIGVLAYGLNLFTTSLTDRDIAVGSVNFTNATKNTIGQINTATLNSLDVLGLFILFGMVIGMLINAYLNRNEKPRFFIIVDIVIIIVAYVISVYVSNSYETILTLEPFATFFTTNLEGASRFILNLPIISVVTGVLIMILTYSGIPRSRREEVFLGST